jgi:hypothetical protein
LKVIYIFNLVDNAIQISNITSNSLNTTNDIIRTELLDSHSLIINTKHAILICITCNSIINDTTNLTHLNNNHGRVTNQMKLNIKQEIIRLGLNLISNLQYNDLEPIQGLPIKNGFKCSICSYVCFSKKNMKVHLKKHTFDTNTTGFTTINVQSLYGNSSQHFEVNELHVRNITTMDFNPKTVMLQNVNLLGEVRLSRATSEFRQVNIFYSMTNWHQYYLGNYKINIRVTNR